MAAGNGNVKPKKVKAERIEEFNVGDLVRLTKKALKDKNIDSSPHTLVRIGMPNLFEVDAVAEFEGRGVCLALLPCCNTMKTPDDEIACTAHDAWMFEKVDLKEELKNARPRKKGDRTVSIVTPLGELVAADYHEDPENPHFQVRVAGLPLDLEGGLAAWVKDLCVANGLFPKTEAKP